MCEGRGGRLSALLADAEASGHADLEFFGYGVSDFAGLRTTWRLVKSQGSGVHSQCF